MRIKNPDIKKASSLIEASERDMNFTLTIKPTESSAPTIIRNIHECFRMLGDALLISRGNVAIDHKTPLTELTKLKVRTTRPIIVIDNIRRLRNNINYYGYKPNLAEVKDIIAIANSIFNPLVKAVKAELK